MKHFYKLFVLAVFCLCTINVSAQQTERDKGIEFYNQGDYQKTVEILQNAVKADKKDETSWLYLGMSLARLNKSWSAASALKRAEHLSDNKKADAPAGKDREAKIISKPRAEYTDEARRNQNQGDIKLAVELGADGQIKGVFPFQTLPNGLTENCVKAAKEIKFEPAVKDGKPVSSIKIVAYSFTIY